jgi:hypothetical protein
MDKSFNEQELSDIMKEIEALEEEFKTGEGQVEASSVMAELAEMEEEVSVPQTRQLPANEQVIPFKSVAPQGNSAKTTSPASAMSFRVQGDITLDLQFDIGGRSIALEVSESGLLIQMDGGVTFNVPLNEKTSNKKAA